MVKKEREILNIMGSVPLPYSQKIILAFFLILTAVFYFFTGVNLAVSMFFAFVVMGAFLIIFLAIPSKKARIFYNFYSD